MRKRDESGSVPISYSYSGVPEIFSAPEYEYEYEYEIGRSWIGSLLP
jgi:hypothetical protein